MMGAPVRPMAPGIHQTLLRAKRLVRHVRICRDTDAYPMLSLEWLLRDAPFSTWLSELAQPPSSCLPQQEKASVIILLCWQLQCVLWRGKSVFSSAFLNTGKSLSRSGQLLLSHWILIVPRIQLPSFRPSRQGAVWMQCDGISNLGGLEKKRTKP